MNRRHVLGAGVTTGLSVLAGCVTGALESEPDGEVVLDAPDDDVGGDPTYPTYGELFPEFALTDPLTESTVDVADLDEESFLVTAFYAECPAECIPLMTAMGAVQSRTIEKGIDDQIRFLAITFDPERDTPDTLQDHADMVHIDLEAGNWHYLRPEDEDEAKDVVDDSMGIAYEVDELEDGDNYDFLHITVTSLVNPAGYVERVYRTEDPDVDKVTEDVETLVERW